MDAKLPSSRFADVPENEFSMMELARRLGMDVSETSLISIQDIENIPTGIERFGSQAFVTKRFDRNDDGTSAHIEDFA